MADIFDILKQHSIPATLDNIWEVRPGQKVYAVKHKVLEKIAAGMGIEFLQPKMLEVNLEAKLAAILVTGKLGDKEEWSIGESTPYNTKAPYPLAMAEKRAKDRVVLKFLAVHGDVYSEEEADAFRRKDA